MLGSAPDEAGSIPEAATTRIARLIFIWRCRQATTSTIASLLTDIGTGVSTVLGWVGNVAETIVSTPLLAMTLVFFVIGGATALIGRMLRKG